MTKEITVTNAQKLAGMLDDKASDLGSVLHKGVSLQTFIRIMKNAIIVNPSIADANHTSIYIECQKAAQDGLVIDNREAALLVYNTNKRTKDNNGKWVDNWSKECTYIPMVAGVIKRVRSSGMIKSWQVQVVYEEEAIQGLFKYQAGDNPHIDHQPIIYGERGPIVAAYSSVKLADGTFHHEVMSVEDINKIRDRTKSKKRDGTIIGPWVDDYSEMAKKTVIKRHAKRLPLSPELSEMVSRDNTMYEGEVNDDGTYGIAQERPERPSIAKKRAKSQAAKKLGISGEIPIDDIEPEDEPIEPDDIEPDDEPESETDEF